MYPRRDGRPDIKRRFRFFEAPAQAVQAVHQHIAALLQKQSRGVIGGMVQRPPGGERDGGELLGVHIAFDGVQGAEGIRAADREADPPAGHVERFRQRMGLNRDFFGPVNLQNARRSVALKPRLGVRAVVQNQRVRFAGEVYGVLKEVQRRDGPVGLLG